MNIYKVTSSLKLYDMDIVKTEINSLEHHNQVITSIRNTITNEKRTNLIKDAESTKVVEKSELDANGLEPYLQKLIQIINEYDAIKKSTIQCSSILFPQIQLYLKSQHLDIMVEPFDADIEYILLHITTHKINYEFGVEYVSGSMMYSTIFSHLIKVI